MFDSIIKLGIIGFMKNKKTADKNLEIGALLEDFNAKFDLVAEQTSQIPDIKSVLNSHSETLGLLYEQTSQIPDINKKIENLTEDMGIVKTDIENLTEDMGIVKTDLEFIKSALKKKVDMDEFSALERRVLFLESRLR
jgi:uncharacterized phage infection (PIP) family protein YhgE